MVVQSILSRKGDGIFAVQGDATIQQAALLMSDHNIGALVVKSAEEVLGILSSRDIVAGLARYRDRLPTIRISELVRREVTGVSPQDDLRSVMALMTRRRMTHVPVFASARLVGIVSLGDVVKHRLEELELEASVLRDAYIVNANMALNSP